MLRSDFGNCLVDSKQLCVKSLRDTCTGIFRRRDSATGLIDDKHIPHLKKALSDVVIVDRVLGGGKSGAIVLMVKRTSDYSLFLDKTGFKKYSSLPVFILKVYLDAYNQFDDVNNERPFREVYTQCIVNGNRGFNCTACFGTADWPSAWVGKKKSTSKKDVSVIIDQNMLVGPPPTRVLYMITSLSCGGPLMKTQLTDYVDRLPGLVMELWAVWLKARDKLGKRFTHWDLHPDNIFIDWDKPRRTAITVGQSKIPFPTVTLIDFDLVQSDVFPEELPEHVQKRKSPIGLTERALQWTMKWLPPKLLYQWLAYLVVLRKITKLNQDMPHLWTYTMVCTLHYIHSLYPDMSIEVLGERLIELLTQYEGDIIAGPQYFSQVMTYVSKLSSVPKASTPSALGTFIYQSIGFNVHISAILLKQYDLLQNSIATKKYSTDLVTTLMKDSGIITKSLKQLAVRIPIIVKNWENMKKTLQSGLDTLGNKYYKQTHRYPSPDDMVISWKFEPFEDDLYGISFTKIQLANSNIELGDLSIFVEPPQLSLKLSSEAFQFRLRMDTEIGIHIGNASDVLWQSASTLLNKFYDTFVGNESKASEHSFRTKTRSLYTWQLEYQSNRFKALSISSIDIQLGNPLIIAVHGILGETTTNIANIILWLFLIVLNVVWRIIPRLRKDDLIIEWKDDAFVATITVYNTEPHVCIAAMSLLSGNNSNLSEALDCTALIDNFLQDSKPSTLSRKAMQNFIVEAMHMVEHNYNAINLGVLLKDNDGQIVSEDYYISYIPSLIGFTIDTKPLYDLVRTRYETISYRRV